jgi:hypothetical protein
MDLFYIGLFLPAGLYMPRLSLLEVVVVVVLGRFDRCRGPASAVVWTSPRIYGMTGRRVARRGPGEEGNQVQF